MDQDNRVEVMLDLVVQVVVEDIPATKLAKLVLIILDQLKKVILVVIMDLAMVVAAVVVLVLLVRMQIATLEVMVV